MASNSVGIISFIDGIIVTSCYLVRVKSSLKPLNEIRYHITIFPLLFDGKDFFLESKRGKKIMVHSFPDKNDDNRYSVLIIGIKSAMN